jgi:hypothetical protein
MHLGDPYRRGRVPSTAPSFLSNLEGRTVRLYVPLDGPAMSPEVRPGPIVTSQVLSCFYRRHRGNVRSPLGVSEVGFETP